VNEPELNFERSAYTADAIQRAAYSMSDQLSIDLTCHDDSYRCVVHVHPGVEEAAAVLGELRIRALDEVLRERIRGETEGVRNLILSLAFSQTGLTTPK
jgi:His-Xaa-Ser system protein HxsD